jgi:hypothetical protein
MLEQKRVKVPCGNMGQKVKIEAAVRRTHSERRGLGILAGVIIPNANPHRDLMRREQ